jgi:hypothetical protein
LLKIWRKGKRRTVSGVTEESPPSASLGWGMTPELNGVFAPSVKWLFGSLRNARTPWM